MDLTNWAEQALTIQKDIAVCICTGEQWIIDHGNNCFIRFFATNNVQVSGQPFFDHLKKMNLISVAQELLYTPEGIAVRYLQKDIHFIFTWHWVDEENDIRAIFAVKMMSTNNAEEPDSARKELEILFESMHDGVWVVDAEGVTLRVNKAMERIAQVRAVDVVGKHVNEAVKLGLTSTCVTLHALKKRQAVTMFDDYANGVRCLNTSTPIFDEDGKIWRVIACIRDISELDTLKTRLDRAEMEAKLYREKLRQIETKDSDHRGTSPAAIQLERTIERTAKVDAPVLLLGETGTGKTISASSIHNQSSRKDKAFITLNCGAIPSELLEAELFGYEAGAFSGASDKGKPGMFELAEGGSLFLDEVAELSLQMQVKLLHVLDGVGYRRLGGVKLFMPDVRIIAATNKEFKTLIDEGLFREDLFYRLRVLVVNIPTLRDRREDIPSLLYYFLEQANKKYGLHKSMTPEMINFLMGNPWPGNIRELRASVELLVAMSEKNLIGIEDTPEHFFTGKGNDALRTPGAYNPKSLKEAVEELETRMIRDALLEGKSTYKAAKLLQTSQSTIVRKAQRYNISGEDISI